MKNETRSIALVGSVGKISPADAIRLAVYVVRGREVLAQGPVQENGAFRVSVARAAVESTSPHGLKIVVAPAGAREHLEHVADAPKLALDRAALAKAEREYRVSEGITLRDAVLKK